MSTIYISPEDQEKIAKGLTMHDSVTAIKSLREKTGSDHIGRATMSLEEFASVVKPHFPGHRIQSNIKDVTGHDIHVDSL